MFGRRGRRGRRGRVTSVVYLQPEPVITVRLGRVVFLNVNGMLYFTLSKGLSSLPKEQIFHHSNRSYSA